MPGTEFNENIIINSDVTINATKSLKDIWDEQIIEIREDIKDNILDVVERRAMLNSLVDIDEHIEENLDSLKEVLPQVNCNILKNDASIAISISQIVYLYIIGNLFKNTSFYLDEKAFKITINSKNHWLFNTAKSSPKKLDTHIGTIAEFLCSSKKCKISSGIAFISQLVNNGSLNCESCTSGKLEIEEDLSKIIPDYTNKYRGVAISDEDRRRDFFDLQTTHNLEFKCGNCVTNLSDISNAKKIL